MTCLKPRAARSPNTLSSAPGLWLKSNGQKPQRRAQVWLCHGLHYSEQCGRQQLCLCRCRDSNICWQPTYKHSGDPGYVVWLLWCAAAPAAPVFPAVVSLAGRGAGTPAQLRSGHSRWHAGTVTAGTVGWHVLLGAVLEVGFCSWLRHQLSAWEICIHLLPALSLRAAPPAVKQGSQLSDAILKLNPVSEAATQRAARFGGH